MIQTEHPWQLGSTELISFALERMHQGSDFDKRLAYLILDVGVETLFKTFLTLPRSVMTYHNSSDERKIALQGNFPDLLRGVRGANPKYAAKYNFSHIEHYHALRNTLYHQGNQVMTVPMDQLKGYASLAVDLLRDYLGVDLSAYLVPPEPELPPSKDPIKDSVEVDLATGRYRLMRFQSQSIRILHLDTGNNVKPVKPFLRDIIVEKALPIQLVFDSGKEKNTRQLGKEVINALKPTSWHGLVPGQKISKETLISMLTGRILDGRANEKNWEVVNYIRSLDHDVLVFYPMGKGVGNSPFNLYCWNTESGERLK